ncbi:helix-turn-helix domain-containing protein [Kitasatospora sp. RG8]|uniref:helix-turn-helix domain-containing protein n=1 Tax=Kitasatospora sp. RG8 TaxID=2820815 RepID=UPI001ADF8D7F|nr:helix-turn-helix domain-containing protein [Kitasatospora sp. RG8]MBP0453520.1 helix-turn-helix domain-containing protein [Kitasatospora sp. RG8]
MPGTDHHQPGQAAQDGGVGCIDVLSPPPGADPDDCLYVALYLDGAASLRRHGASTALEPGDLLIGTTPQPADLLRDPGCRMVHFRVPCFYLGVRRGDVRRAGGLMARGSEGIGSLASQFLRTLAGQIRAHRARPGNHLARSVSDIVAILVTDLLERQSPVHPTAAAGMLSRIRAHIEENLADPDLSPESIARSQHISVRYLHKLFQQEGMTVGQWVRRRRLDVCRRELERPSRRQTSVSAVAHRWGFVSHSHFSRAFRDAYGVSPREWQAYAAQTDGHQPPGWQASGHRPAS